MTPLEFDFIKRAMDALENGNHDLPSQRKMLQIISEITAKAADAIKQNEPEAQHND